MKIAERPALLTSTVDSRTSFVGGMRNPKPKSYGTKSNIRGLLDRNYLLGALARATAPLFGAS
jgi:hypothetical protein